MTTELHNAVGLTNVTGGGSGIRIECQDVFLTHPHGETISVVTPSGTAKATIVGQDHDGWNVVADITF